GVEAPAQPSHAHRHGGDPEQEQRPGATLGAARRGDRPAQLVRARPQPLQVVAIRSHHPIESAPRDLLPKSTDVAGCNVSAHPPTHEDQEEWMPKAFDTWRVFPHRGLEKLEPNLWRVEGDLPGGNGTRVMTVARMRDGGLVIHSAIALEEPLMAELEA